MNVNFHVSIYNDLLTINILISIYDRFKCNSNIVFGFFNLFGFYNVEREDWYI